MSLTWVTDCALATDPNIANATPIKDLVANMSIFSSGQMLKVELWL